MSAVARTVGAVGLGIVAMLGVFFTFTIAPFAVILIFTLGYLAAGSRRGLRRSSP